MTTIKELAGEMGLFNDEKPIVRYVEWIEPWHYHDISSPHPAEVYINRTIRVTVEDAIKMQKANAAFENRKNNRHFTYKSDEMALNDFVVTCWGKIVEDY